MNLVRDLLFWASKGSEIMFTDSPTETNLAKHNIIKDLYTNYINCDITKVNNINIIDGSNITFLDMVKCAIKYIDNTTDSDSEKQRVKNELYLLYLIFTGRNYNEDYCE